MSETKNNRPEISEIVLNRIKEQIEKIEYGSVTVVVHDGRVVQLDTSTKIRLL